MRIGTGGTPRAVLDKPCWLARVVLVNGAGTRGAVRLDTRDGEPLVLYAPSYDARSIEFGIECATGFVIEVESGVMLQALIVYTERTTTRAQRIVSTEKRISGHSEKRP